MDKYLEFKTECDLEIRAMESSHELNKLSNEWLKVATKFKYTYHFEWLGRPIIQLPQDVLALQEIIWDTRPDIVIETGIAHGGSLVLSASILALLDLVDLETGVERRSKRKVFGVDIDIRKHNRDAIEAHPLSSRIEMFEDSSTSAELINLLKSRINSNDRVMVILDSNHTESHVLDELRAYADFVSSGCYLVVFDTVIQFLDAQDSSDRPWGIGNNPWTAVQEFLREDDRFLVNTHLESKLQLTVAPSGFLKKK